MPGFFHRFPARKNVHIFSATILAEQPFDRGTGVKLNEWLQMTSNMKGLAMAYFWPRQRKLKNENLLLNGSGMLKGHLCVILLKK